MRGKVFMVEYCALKVGGKLPEALQPLRYRQNAGTPVDHAVLGKFNLVLQVDIGFDKYSKVTADLLVCQRLLRVGLACVP